MKNRLPTKEMRNSFGLNTRAVPLVDMNDAHQGRVSFLYKS
jgi:hypothetical protein